MKTTEELNKKMIEMQKMKEANKINAKRKGMATAVKGIISPILKALADDEATVLSLNEPIFFEDLASLTYEKVHTDNIHISKLLSEGFVTVEQIEDMADGTVYEEILIPYEILTVEAMAEILSEVGFSRYESY